MTEEKHRHAGGEDTEVALPARGSRRASRRSRTDGWWGPDWKPPAQAE